MRRTMPLALALLTVFSLIPGLVNALSWTGFSGQGDGFQRGDRITSTHMNQIDTAFNDIKSELLTITSAGGDAVNIQGSDYTGINLIDGDGILFDLTGANSPKDVTINITLDTGSGLQFNNGALTLLKTCADGQVLTSSSGAWSCGAGGGGGSTLTVDGGNTIALPNFITGSGGAGILDVDFVQSTQTPNNISGQIAMSSITSVGTLTATEINGALTLSDGGVKFTSGVTTTCSSGQGSIYFDGTIFKKCQAGTTTDLEAGDVDADQVLIKSNQITDANGVNFLEGNGVGITYNDSVSPDTATLNVKLNGTIDGTGTTSSLSGLEFTATEGLALLQGCADTEILEWDDEANSGPGVWKCASKLAGSSAVKINNGGVEATLDLRDSSTVHINVPTGNPPAGTFVFDVQGGNITTLGDLTTQLVVPNTGVEFVAGDVIEATDANPADGKADDCVSQFGTNGGLFFDASEGIIKKCENGVLSTLLSGAITVTGGLTVPGATVLNNTLNVGTTTNPSGRVMIGGDANQRQLVVQGAPETIGQTAVGQSVPVFTVSSGGKTDLNPAASITSGTSVFSVDNVGVAKARALNDIEDANNDWRIQDGGEGYFTSLGDSGGPSTWFINTNGKAVFDEMIIGADITGTDSNSTVKIGGERNQRQLLIKGATDSNGNNIQSGLVPVFEVESGGAAGTKTTQIFQNGVIRTEAIQDITGPGTNWSIVTNGAAKFDSITDNTAGTPTWSISNVGDASLKKALIGDQNPFDSQIMYKTSFSLVPTVIVASENKYQTPLVVTAHPNSGTDPIVDAPVFRVDRKRTALANLPLFTVDPDGTVYADAIQPHDALPDWSIGETGLAFFSNIRAGNAFGFDSRGFDAGFPSGGGYPALYRGNDVDNNLDANMQLVCGNTNGYIGCDLNWHLGRNITTVPELQIVDRVSAGGVEKNYITNNEPILLNAPIIDDTTGTPGIDLARGTIQGLVETETILMGNTVFNPKGQWYFVNDSGGEINLGATTPGFRSGQNVCFQATTTGVFRIKPYLGPAIYLNGVRYGQDGMTPPALVSSGSPSDFVCLLAANPSGTRNTWYVLGRSGTWTAEGTVEP